MKIVILLLIIQSRIMACMCASELQQAFEKMETKIFTENVDKMYDKLKVTNERTQDNIDALIERVGITKERVELNSIYLKELIRSRKQENTLRKVDM